MAGEARAPDLADESFLDGAFERAVAALEQGANPRVEDLLEGREHLRAQVEALLRTARQATLVASEALPEVRGFVLQAEIGRGGMGTVYLARQETLAGRRVALKVLPATAALSPRARERFLREARAIASLRHPNVVTVYDVRVDGDTCAYAMEWVEGASLGELIDCLRRKTRGAALEGAPRVPASLALEPTLADVREFLGGGVGVERDTYALFVSRIAVALARALGELHRAGLLHRDIKPSNVLLRRDGTPLLSDFGLVRDVDGTVTQDGQFVGTLAYASPEQLGGDSEAMDARSDVYAFGVTLYQALTLHLPFDDPRGERLGARPRRELTPTGMLRRIESRQAVPLRAWNRRLPRDLETIVLKALDADRARRYASADELADDLERMLSLQPIRARPAGLASRSLKLLRRNRAAALGIVGGSLASLALALSAMVYVFLVPRWVEAHVREARLALMDPLQANLLFVNVYWGAQVNDGSAVPERAGLRAAVEHYDSALRWAPFDEAIRLERDVVLGVLDAPRTARLSAPAAPDDLRSAGLAAYLFGDVESALRSWERFELGLDPTAASDPLVETGLGILYLIREESARAYPRLRDACQAFPDVGFLTTYLADAALRCGDHDVAERLLAAAARMPRQDPQLALSRIRAGLLAARGQDAEAEALYRRSQPGTPANLHHARFLHTRGRVEEAIDQYVLAVSAMGGARVRAEYARVLEEWWAELGPEERSRCIRASVGRSPWDPRSLVTRLRYYVASAQPEEPPRAQPLRALESRELAQLARVLDVENTAHWNGILEYAPLFVRAERWALGSPWRTALSRIVRQLAAAWELVRGGSPQERAASPPLVVLACSDAPCFQGLGDLPGGEVRSFAKCLSSDGSTVGGRAGGRHESEEPFVWRAETGMVSLGVLGSSEGWGCGLSADGSVAVGTVGANGAEHAFRWTRSEGPVTLHASDGAPTMAHSVSDDGFLVAGQSCAESWRAASTWSLDGLWAALDAGVRIESAVNGLSRDGRWAAGYIRSLFGAPVQAVRWSLTGGERLVAARESNACDVSDSGTVVGYFQRKDPSDGRLLREAMCWTRHDAARSLGDLPGGALHSDAAAILPDGTWISGGGTSALGEEAVLWDESRRLYRVTELLDASGVSVPSGWRLRWCGGIARNGDLLTICGNGTNPAGHPEAWIARIRVPTSVPPSAAPDAR